MGIFPGVQEVGLFLFYCICYNTVTGTQYLTGILICVYNGILQACILLRVH